MSDANDADELRLSLSHSGRLFATQEGRACLPTKLKGDCKRVCDEIKCSQIENCHKNEHACASLALMLNSNKAELDVH